MDNQRFHNADEQQTRSFRPLPAALAGLGCFAIGLASFSLAGCGTVEGAGEDIEYAGGQLDEASEDVQDD